MDSLLQWPHIMLLESTDSFQWLRNMRVIWQPSQFNTNLSMAKWADQFPDTCWEKKLHYANM